MATTEIEMDLFADVADQCRNQLQAAGYTPPPGDEDAVRAYLNVNHRRVAPRPRNVHKAAYPVPAHLAPGEKALLEKVARGEDVRPHQSTKLADANYDDAMLNDFGIQHFHLGTTPHPTNPLFTGRTGELLFAVVRPDDFYAIGIYSHNDWAKLEPLDVMHTQFPAVFSSSIVQGAIDVAFTPTEEEMKNLRKAGINVFTKRADGSIQAPPGGGQTLGGGSMLVTMGVNKLRQMADQVERQLRALIEPMINTGALPPKVKVRLEIRGQQTFAVVEKHPHEFDLQGALWVAPL